MAARGKLIAIEGVDGSGKRTQAELLGRALELRGIPLARFSFPRYESSFGRLVARFLNGEFGPLETVDGHLSALLYAGDRFEAKTELESALNGGKSILTDRYIGSNLAHQTARIEPGQRAAFMDWLRNLEYGIYGLPREDVVIYLHLPASEAQRMIALKDARDYTTQKRDLQEANLAHLQGAAQVYDQLASDPRWVTIECFDAAAQRPRPPAEIHRDVLAAVEARLGLRAVAL